MSNQVKSQLLSDLENKSVFNGLGKGCFSLATCVAQLFIVHFVSKRQTKWVKKCCGAVCFVKDNRQKSYFIRIYDPTSQQLLWQQELYTKFKYNTPKEFFHTFEAQDCHVGLNFASEDEAVTFKETIEEKLMEREMRRLEREKRRQLNEDEIIESTEKFSKEELQTGSVYEITCANVKPESIEIKTPEDTPTIRKKKQKKQKKLTKDDVGMPFDFRHISHLSWDENDGPHLDRLDTGMKSLLEQIGIKERSEVDLDTMDFIYDFVDKHGGVSAVKKDFVSWRMSSDLSHPVTDMANQFTAAVPSHPVKDTRPPASSLNATAHTPLLSGVRVVDLKPITKPTRSAIRTPFPTSKRPNPKTRPPSPTSKPPLQPKPSKFSIEKQTVINSKAVHKPLTSPVDQEAVRPNVTSPVRHEAVCSSIPSSVVHSNDKGQLPHPIHSATPSAPKSLNNMASSLPIPKMPEIPHNTLTSNIVPATLSKSADPPHVTVPAPPTPPPAPVCLVSETQFSHANKSKAGILLNEIQAFKGGSLNQVASEQEPPERNVLLREIRTGTVLKHVDKSQKPSPQKRGSIAAALMSELVKRKTIIQFSDNEDSSDEFDDDWDD